MGNAIPRDRAASLTGQPTVCQRGGAAEQTVSTGQGQAGGAEQQYHDHSQQGWAPLWCRAAAVGWSACFPPSHQRQFLWMSSCSTRLPGTAHLRTTKASELTPYLSLVQGEFFTAMCQHCNYQHEASSYLHNATEAIFTKQQGHSFPFFVFFLSLPFYPFATPTS